jgi:Magnesium chelatase, subunit ChlI
MLLEELSRPQYPLLPSVDADRTVNVMQVFCPQRPPHRPPGARTALLARRLTTLRPAMTLAEALETTRIHSVAGLTGDRIALVTTRPFRAPHHPTSGAGLIGGGHGTMLGEVSLAHNGVLFLDELPEFRRHVLEVLRQPLDDRMMTVARESPFAPPLFRLTLPAELRKRNRGSQNKSQLPSAPLPREQAHLMRTGDFPSSQRQPPGMDLAVAEHARPDTRPGRRGL